MTPKRASEIAKIFVPYGHMSDAVNAIIAACAEERNDALTEAAEACREGFEIHPVHIREMCAITIEALRDKS